MNAHESRTARWVRGPDGRSYPMWGPDWREGHRDECSVWLSDRYDCSCGETIRRGAIVRRIWEAA